MKKLLLLLFIVFMTGCDNSIEEIEDYKPVLYFYPEEDINVSVKFSHPEYLLTTYPKYDNGWEVKVLKNGTIVDKNREYYALYWDEKSKDENNFEECFYVDGDSAISFLEEKLKIIGLTDRETNEFIMYWLPVLEKNKKSIVNFDFTDELQKDNKIMINPKPDNLFRVNINIKKVDNKVKIKQQSLERVNREGFTVVSWGGSIYDK